MYAKGKTSVAFGRFMTFAQKREKNQDWCLGTSPSSLFYWIQNYILLFPAVNCAGIRLAIHHLGEKSVSGTPL